MKGKQSMAEFRVSEIPPFKPRGHQDTRKSLIANEFSYQEEDEYDDDDDDDDDKGNAGEVFNDETSLASTISSAASTSSQLSKDLNLQVEIGVQNSLKNRDILHELSQSMKHMPTISLDSESMNRGSFLKSVTFAEEDDVLEFDYKRDIIFPDYETPIKDRSKLLGSSLEDDEDNDKMKTETTVNVDTLNINEDGISGWNTNSKILAEDDENNTGDIENKSENVQDSTDRITAAMNELRLQLIHELCPVNEWISHKSDLLIPKKESSSSNTNATSGDENVGKKKKKKKASFVAFSVDTDNAIDNNTTINIPIAECQSKNLKNDNNFNVVDNINSQKPMKVLSFGDGPIDTIDASIPVKSTVDKVKKKKGISFRMDTDKPDDISPISIATNFNSNATSPIENSSLGHFKASPPKHVTVIGSLRTEALAVPRDVIDTHIEAPSVCLGGSMTGLQSSETKKFQMQSINGSAYFPLDPKTSKIRLTISSDLLLDLSSTLPRTVQYRRRDSVKPISIYHHDPADQEFYNCTKMNSNNLAFELMGNFLNKQSMGFLCMLIDKNLQVLGTYDDALSSEDQATGLIFGPSFYRIPTHKQKRNCLLKANLVQIDLNDFSDDVFAVIPIAYDECMKGLSDVNLDNSQKTSKLSFGFYSTKQNRYASEAELSLSEEVASQCDGFSGIGGFKFTNQSAGNKEILEEIASLECQRNLKHSNNNSVFGLGQGIIPGIVFRNGVEGEWALKTIGKVVSADKLDMLYGQVLDVMIEQYIIPFHLAHIEHCHNCSDHQMSTRHEPGSYEDKFNQLRDDISSSYPPIIFVANDKDLSPKPRLGSFELSFQSFGDDTTNLIFSKLKKGDFPTIDIISAELDTILNLDNSLRFGRGHVPKFKIALADAYNNKPIQNAVLKLYRLSNKVTGNDCFKRNSNKGGSPKKPVVLTDSDIRHSDAYAHVRSWGKDDIMKWFLSAGASEESAKNAIFAGVVDGTSLLKLVDTTSLQKWGVINRRHLKKLEEFLISIKGGKKTSEGFSDNQTLMVSQEKQCALILQQSSDDNGICSFNIDISGSYYVKVDAPHYETYFTHSILVDSVQKFLYSASLQPLLIQFKVTIDIDLDDSNWLSIIYAGRGLIQSFYNIETGKRHFIRIKIPSNLIENKMATEMAQIYGNDVSLSNDADVDSGADKTKKTYSKVTGSMYLPLGIYFNEVSGTILNLYKNDADVNNNNDNDDDNYIIPSSSKKKNKQVHFDSKPAIRCHNRLMVKSIRKLQRLYRRYYLKQREWLYATIMRCQLKLTRSLKRARERIATRKAVIIQACFRRYKQEMNYNVVLNGVILVQSVHRGNLGRKRIRIIIEAASIVSHWITAWILFLRRKAIMRVKEEQRRIEEEIRRAEEERQEQERIRLLKIEREKRERERREQEEQTRLEKAQEERQKEKERQEKEEQKSSAKALVSKSMFKGGGIAKKENLLAGVAKAPIISSNTDSSNRNSLSPSNDKLSSHKVDSPNSKEDSSSPLAITSSPNANISNTGSPTAAISNESPSSSKAKNKKIGNIRNKFKKNNKIDNAATEVSSKIDDENTNTNVGAVADDFVEPDYLKDEFVVKTTPIKEVNEKLHQKGEDTQSAATVTVEDASTQMTPLPTDQVANVDPITTPSTPLTEYQMSGYIYDNSGSKPLTIDTSTLHGEEEYLRRVLPDRLKRIASMSPMKILQDSTKLAHHHITKTTTDLVNTIKSSKTIKKLISKTSELREKVPRGIQELRRYLNKKQIIRDKSATLIQAMIRGAQSRFKSFQDEKFKDFIETFYPIDKETEENNTASEKGINDNVAVLPIDRPRFRPNISIVIDGKPQLEQSEKGDGKATPIITSSNAPKTPIGKIKDALNTGIRIASEKTTPLAQNFEIISKMIKKDLTIAKEITSIKGQALVSAISSKIAARSNAAILATEEYLINKQNELDRKIRKEAFKFTSADAILNVHGTFMETIPTISSYFYIAIYPQASDDPTSFGIDDVIEKVDEDTGIKVKVYPFRAKRDRVIERHSNKEGTQSTFLYPFSPEQFMMSSFNCHLVDVSRYTTCEICVFIEVESSLEYFGRSKPEDPYVHEGKSMMEGIPPASKDEKTKGPGLRRYVPAFYGDINIARGGIFGPQGGRLHVSLSADKEMVMQLEKTPNFAALKNLDMIVTLMPVSIPSSSFLHTFRSIERVAPCYPSFLVDAELLEHKEVEIDRDNIGATVSLGAIGNRIFVSTRNRGIPYGVVEYNMEGKIEKKLCDADQLDTVNQIICGHNHIACCGSNGNILFLYEGKSSTAIKNSIVESHPGRLLISFGCVSVHGGMDIFFTGDKSGNICVSFMDNGKCLRQYLNKNFIRSRISSMNVYGSRLYISQSDGVLTVINIQPIFQGMYESAGQLHNMVVLEDSIFSKESGIICSAIASPNGFLGIKDEDEVTKDNDAKFSKVKKNIAVSQYCADIVEGHILLLGGGDASPHIAILQPFILQTASRSSSMREVATLINAHEKAVTQIVVDAAGRHIFSASAGAKQIKIWDGLSFTVERQIDDINVTYIALAPSCFLVGSGKAPFFRMWKCKNNKKPTDTASTLMARSPANNNNVNNEIIESTPDIVTYRNPRWCTSVLLGKPPPSKSLIKAISTDDDTMNVLTRWSLQYIRPDDDSYIRNRPPPPHSANGKATPRRIRNTETPRARARRQYEKKLLSPEKESLTIPPRRLQRVTESSTKVQVTENIKSDNNIETDTPTTAPPSPISKVFKQNKRKLHFSDSEEDE